MHKKRKVSDATQYSRVSSINLNFNILTENPFEYDNSNVFEKTEDNSENTASFTSAVYFKQN